MTATQLDASQPNLEEEAKDYIKELETELDEPLELDKTEPPPKPSIELKPLPLGLSMSSLMVIGIALSSLAISSLRRRPLNLSPC